MKKVVIVGKTSYIGSYYQNYAKNIFDLSIVSSRNGDVLKSDYSGIDVVFCPIGIAHVSTDPSMEKQYYAINRDLPVAIAQKAKRDGVNHFIFLSSMIVYGDDLSINQSYTITESTPSNPVNFYGKSKLEAEKALLALQDDSFLVSVLRLPMVYGPGCKGNFPKLLKIAQKFPLCPMITNQRSMIYIDNLCEYISFVINNRISGILYPQNKEYVSTTAIIQTAAKYFHNKIRFTRIFNPVITLLSKKIQIINRIYGTKVYDKGLSPNLESYNIVDFETSIKRCVDAIKG